MFHSVSVTSLLGVLLTLIATAPACLGQGTLDDLRGDVRTDTPEDDEPPRKRHRDDDYDDCSDDDELWGGLMAYFLTSPFWAPHVLLGDSFHAQGEFLSYPYKRDWYGNMIIDEPVSPFTKWWHIRARGEYAHDFDRLSRAGGHILFDTTSRFGFDTSFDYRQETSSSGPDDELWTGDFNFLYRFAQSEFVQMRTGIGGNWLSDEIGSDWGFNFTYGGDLMPLRPFILSTEIDWGRLGKAGLFHGRATVGVEYRHVELYTGFDYFDVGATQINGWIAGMRFWF